MKVRNESMEKKKDRKERYRNIYYDLNPASQTKKLIGRKQRRERRISQNMLGYESCSSEEEINRQKNEDEQN